MQVAGYCRVSTDKEDQAHSFSSQKQYFTTYITDHPAWELFCIYADEGISGTSTKNRTAFCQMLQDAREGRFSLLLTKEVSRFSRNILDTIYYTRELRTLGIGVLFLNDGINSLEPDAELRLSLMGSIAQEESRKTSSRVKWGQTRRMEQGVVFGRSMLGYNVKEGVLSIEPKGAELVRKIFYQYVLERKGTTGIARDLQAQGIPTYTGKSQWNSGQILKILKNEKYVGDLIQKKTYTPNYLTHEKKRNRGQEPLIILRDHHEAIVDRALWEAAQEEIRSRNVHRNHSAGRAGPYLCSGKVICGLCGSKMVCRSRTRRDGSVYRCWVCQQELRTGKRHQLRGSRLRDDDARAMIRQVWSALSVDRAAVCRQLRKNLPKAASVQAQSICETLLLEPTEPFLRQVLEKIEVYPDYCRVWLAHLSQTWQFQRMQSNTDVPMSVSSPCSSGNGME